VADDAIGAFPGIREEVLKNISEEVGFCYGRAAEAEARGGPAARFQRHTPGSVSPRQRKCLSISHASCRPDDKLVLELFLDPGSLIPSRGQRLLLAADFAALDRHLGTAYGVHVTSGGRY
jgi:hypothetical protein